MSLGRAYIFQNYIVSLCSLFLFDSVPGAAALIFRTRRGGLKLFCILSECEYRLYHFEIHFIQISLPQKSVFINSKVNWKM